MEEAPSEQIDKDVGASYRNGFDKEAEEPVDEDIELGDLDVIGS